MIELYIFLTLGGLGYILTRTKSNNINIINNRKPEYVNNVYNSNYLKQIKKKEFEKGNKAFKLSETPEKSKVISSNYRDIINKKKEKSYESKLSGENIDIEKFKHNNMTPFFGSSVKQNMDHNVNDSILEKFTGVGDLFKTEKQEALCFADIKDNVGDVYGNQPNYEDRYNRMKDTINNSKNNELPFEKINIGPGLNKGFDDKGSDGFHPDTREYMLPKTVDELRVQSKPKETYEGRVLSGQKELKRGYLGKVNKNKVERFYENSSDRYLKTTGAFKKDSFRPCHIVKDTNRKTSTEYKGNLYKNIGNEQSKKLQPTKKTILSEFGYRNTDLTNKGKGSSEDYGKHNILVYNNERDVTSTRTYEGNLTSLVKSIIAPIQDSFKPTTKEYTVQNVREFGEIQQVRPEKQTIYDPNEVARTTIKETLIHDTRTGPISSEIKSIVYDPDDISKTTLRETLPNYDNSHSFKGGAHKQTVYDPNDPMKTTIKETTEDSKRDGNVGNLEGGGGYETNDMEAPNVSRQFISDEEYMGAGPSIQNQDGYMNKDIQMETTQREILNDIEHYGMATAGSDKKFMSYTDIYNATINEIKEDLIKNRKPTKVNAKLPSGGDNINMENKKTDCERENLRDANNIEKIYDQPIDSTFVTLTQDKFNVMQVDDTMNDLDTRLDPDILKAFNENPYTKPLNSSF